jgi:hypothetical protein
VKRFLKVVCELVTRRVAPRPPSPRDRPLGRHFLILAQSVICQNEIAPKKPRFAPDPPEEANRAWKGRKRSLSLFFAFWQFSIKKAFFKIFPRRAQAPAADRLPF